MEKRIYLIYDLKAEAPVSNVLQTLGTDAEATRMFSSVLQAPGSLVSEHPTDFNLLHVGTIDMLTLKITPNLNSLHLPVARGADIVRELQRARNSANPATADTPEGVMRDQLSIPGVAVS